MLIQIQKISCFIIIHFLLGTSYGKENHPCAPSSCGSIPNISYPFRLTDDPKHCGKPKYQLSCENNITYIYFLKYSQQKYIGQTINYSNYTIRLTDAALNIYDNCSFPHHSLSPSNFGRDYHSRSLTNFGSDYSDYSVQSFGRLYRGVYELGHDITRSITLVSCPYPVNNSLLTQATHCFDKNYGRRRTYVVKFGVLNGSYVMDMCTIELIVMTSLPLEDGKRLSLSEIHSSLLYGFELSWFSALCDSKCLGDCWLDGEKVTCEYCNLLFTIFGDYRCGGVPVWFADVFYWTTGILMYAIVLTVVLRIFIGMPCMLGLLIYKLRRRHLSTFDIIEGFLRSNNNLMPIRYSYSNLKKMTKGFHENLGKGGYGSVYKGKLRSGHYVAVKVLGKSGSNGQDFINEIATIGRIHHVNVVKLVGYCAERSKRALVYDFMPNGSLEKYIFNPQTSKSLSWERKYEIAIGVARGIEYLHRGCDIQILHFDIKPHNILLDENFIPKISDFGLAKFYSTEKNTVTLTAARGTIGYVAPELINRSIGEVSYKADVYSFGMLLMEMVGLKRDVVIASDDESSQYFPYWIYDRFNKGKNIKIENIDEDDNEYARKVTKKMIVVGLWCIQMWPVDRPSMRDVLKMLEGEDENLQIPPFPSESPQIECYNNQTSETEWTDSLTLYIECDTSSEPT